MKKFSRMPKSESGSLGGGSGSGTGSSNYIGKVFAVGRYQVTVEELIAEGNGPCVWATHITRWQNLLVKFIRAPPNPPRHVSPRAMSSSGKIYQSKHVDTTGCTSPYT